MTVEPYYSDDFVTLYHGDCREITAWLEADVLVTDPPYGMDYIGFTGRPSRIDSSKHDGSKHGEILGDLTTEVRDEALRAWGDGPALVFGTWRAERPQGVRRLIIWDKSANGPGMGALDLPWGPAHEDIYVIGTGFVGKRRPGIYRHSPYNSQDAERPDHPTPKPLALMSDLIAHTVGTIADPFAGSGSTLLAARRMGRKVIGVELDERHCETIANRLAQHELFVT